MARSILLVLAAVLSLGLAGAGCGDTTCIYQGKTYPAGATFPASDGCNTCTCGVDGVVGCTLIGCIDLRWYETCGDPVCDGHQADPAVSPCTDERPGEGCAIAGQSCDPIDDCNVRYVCSDADPRAGGC